MAENDVQAALTEINAALEDQSAAHEGLRDYAKLEMSDKASRDIDAAIEDYDRRKQLLETAKTALDALVEDGYPDLNVREVSESSLKEMSEQQRTITAALGRFASNAATGLELANGEPERK